MNEWFFPRGSLARDGWTVVVDEATAPSYIRGSARAAATSPDIWNPAAPGWRHTGLRVADLDGAITLPAGGVERMLVPLHGSFAVVSDDERWRLDGRASVFDGPTDVLYLGVGRGARIEGTGRIAVAEAPADVRLPSARMDRSEVPVEIRGAGPSTRQVHNFGVPGALPAQRLIVCEVVTPSANWSSYPAHKHDEASATESRLEEIYYFEAAVARGLPAPAGVTPFGHFVTSSSPAGEISTHATVTTGDVALVPFGYHGPAAAAPEHDLYYLNVMAGPDPDRAWRISDDPAHGWIRETWADQEPDPRLPYLAKEQGA